MSGIETAALAGGDEAVGQAIAQVERLYRAVTGKEPPQEAGYAPIPAEKDPVRHVEEQMDRLFGMMGRAGIGSLAAWTPPVTVWEAEKELVVCIDVPGVNREAVTVQIEGGLLTVTGERPLPAPDGARLQWSERPVGTFRRTVTLGTVSRTGEPSAQIRDGVLEVRVPREAAAATPPRTIAVG